MESENKKRAREAEAAAAEEERNAKKRDTWRPAGVFEFPWEKGEGPGTFLHGSDGWDLIHVFFSSLVDGRSAAIGVPGDRLSLPMTKPLAVFDDAFSPSDEDANGVDCIWSAVLREPLFGVRSDV